MGYQEAIEDHVRMKKQNNRDSWYYPPCCNCGKEVPSWGYIRGIKYLCKECKMEKALSDKQIATDSNAEAKEKKFQHAVERALKVIKQKDEAGYVRAAEIIHRRLHKAGWFESTEEILAAIELVKSGVKTRHQVKFGSRYRADFVLPELKIILEIDGVCYHTERTRQKEELRDSLIISALGPGWEVIRITDELINQDVTKLVPAIKRIQKERQKVRDKNNGALPCWYTDRRMA